MDKKMVEALAIFYDTFNRRPINHDQKIPELYYSEKLITKNQLNDYENAIEEIRRNYQD